MILSGRLAEDGLKPFIEEKFQVGNRHLPKIWILVVDARCAHFFRKPNHHLEKIGESLPNESADNNPTHDMEVFIKSVAEYTNKAAGTKAFDRLILISPPKALGVLRHNLNKTVHEKLNAEMDKDLSHLDEKQLYEYLNKMLWV